MPTSATPKQVFDRVLYNELKFLTQPKLDPAKVRKENEALQRNVTSKKFTKSSNHPPWHKVLLEAKERSTRGERQGVRNPGREPAEKLQRALRYQKAETARNAGLQHENKLDASDTVTSALSDSKSMTESAPSWDALIQATGKPRKGAKGAHQNGNSSKKAAHTATPRAPPDSKSMARESASSWDALMQATGKPQKGSRKGQQNQGHGQTGMGSPDGAAKAPKAAWEMAYAAKSPPKGKGGKKRGGAKSRKRKGGNMKSGFDWGRFSSGG